MPRSKSQTFRGCLLITISALGSAGCRAKTEKPAPHAPQSAATEAPLAKSNDADQQPDESPPKPAAGGPATTTLPAAILESIVGCWQLEDRERWMIQRTGANGAQVVRELLEHADRGSKAGYAKRAALPAPISFNAAENTLGFSTAGPSHALLFVFSVNADELEGRWATSHAPGAAYEWLAGNVSLRRCAAAPNTPEKTVP